MAKAVLKIPRMTAMTRTMNFLELPYSTRLSAVFIPILAEPC